MSDIQRWGLSTKWINQLRWVKSKTGPWYKVVDVEVDRKADRDRIKELEETNRGLRSDLNEAQQVVKARDQRINAFEEEFGIVAQEEQDNE